jgi:hypothetical protein
VIVKDLYIAPDRSGPRASVLFALNMALYTDGGDVHDEEALADFLGGRAELGRLGDSVLAVARR